MKQFKQASPNLNQNLIKDCRRSGSFFSSKGKESSLGFKSQEFNELEKFRLAHFPDMGFNPFEFLFKA